MATGPIGNARGLGGKVGGVPTGLLGGDPTMGTMAGGAVPGVTTPAGAEVATGAGLTGDLPGSGLNGRIIGASFHFVVTLGFSVDMFRGFFRYLWLMFRGYIRLCYKSLSSQSESAPLKGSVLPKSGLQTWGHYGVDLPFCRGFPAVCTDLDWFL